MTGQKILLCDTDVWRRDKVAQELTERGYLCSTISSIEKCFFEMESEEYTHIFLGRIDGSMLDILVRAKEKQVELVPYDVFDAEDRNRLVKMAVTHIMGRLSAQDDKTIATQGGAAVGD